MSELWTLLLLCFAMLVGCFLAGMVPLTISFSESKLRLVTVLGAGLLVGTALVIIIPEGVFALMNNPETTPPSISPDHDGVVMRNIREATNKPLIPILHEESKAHIKPVLEDHHHHDDEHSPPINNSPHSDHPHHHGNDLHGSIGVSLILGFVFMLLIDQLASGVSHSAVSLETSAQNRHKITATLGLVVHAAADGIALGAAASTSQTHIEMIVFVAIMLHKAPAAFGLVSFLLHEGLDRNRIRRHLTLFSVAAPFMALLTYFGLGQSSKEALTTNHVTGLAMLFSGGTFLYVATVHILPELNQNRQSSTTFSNVSLSTQNSPISPHPNSGITIHHHHQHKGFDKVELLFLVVGCLSPLLLAFGHQH